MAASGRGRQVAASGRSSGRGKFPAFSSSAHGKCSAFSGYAIWEKAAARSHLQPLEWPQVAADGKWPQVAASGRRRQVAASGRKGQVAASGRKWPPRACAETFPHFPLQPMENVGHSPGQEKFLLKKRRVSRNVIKKRRVFLFKQEKSFFQKDT